MTLTALEPELEDRFKAAEGQGVCVAARSDAERMMFGRRIERRLLFSPYPGLYERACWNTPQHARVVARRVIRTLGLQHPDWVFTSYSAALLYGLWVPQAQLHPIRVCVRRGGRARKTRGLVAKQIPLRSLAQQDDCLVTSLEQTLVECALDARVCHALVPIDSAWRFMDVNEDLLRATLALAKNRRGARTARLAVAHGDGRAENGGESLVRGRILEEGFAPPDMLQVPFYDPVDGRSVMRVDMLWDLPGGRRVAGEVDGMQKYVDEDMLGGRTTVETLVDERQRESHLTALGIPVMRFLVKSAFKPGYMDGLLRAYSIPLR